MQHAAILVAIRTLPPGSQLCIVLSRGLLTIASPGWLQIHYDPR
jgi:hypothetical protein